MHDPVKCVCPYCGGVHFRERLSLCLRPSFVGYAIQGCPECLKLDPVDRDTLMSIRCRKVEGRKLTKKQAEWLNRHPKYEVYRP